MKKYLAQKVSKVYYVSFKGDDNIQVLKENGFNNYNNSNLLIHRNGIIIAAGDVVVYNYDMTLNCILKASDNYDGSVEFLKTEDIVSEINSLRLEIMELNDIIANLQKDKNNTEQISCNNSNCKCNNTIKDHIVEYLESEDSKEDGIKYIRNLLNNLKK